MLLGAQQIANFFQTQPEPSTSKAEQAPARAEPSRAQLDEQRPGREDTAQNTRRLWQRHATRSRTRTRSRAQLCNPTELTNNATGPSNRAKYLPDNHPLSAPNLTNRGYHSFSCLRVTFYVKKRYSFLRELGIGAYGCVALAYDTETKQEVAIKKVGNVFGRELLTRRALREVVSLRCLLGCNNVAELIEFDTTFLEFSEVYLVLKASDADLFQILRSNQTLTEAHVKYFMVQLLRAVHYMHSMHILHRDLKPGNLLVNSDCSLRVCDFGMARAFQCAPSEHTHLCRHGSVKRSSNASDVASECTHQRYGNGLPLDQRNEEASNLSSPEMLDIEGNRTSNTIQCQNYSHPNSTHFQVASRPTSPATHDEGPMVLDTQNTIHFPGGPLTEYVSTRWYRAPEVMLCFQNGYGPPIDIWSTGCILAELLSGQPLFPGKDYIDQLALIRGVLGSPSEQVLQQVGSQKAKEHMESLAPCSGVSFSTILPNAPEPALDLLAGMLHWDPSKRISAADALAHPWLSRYRDASFSVKIPEPFQRFDEVEMLHTPSEFKQALEQESQLLAKQRHRTSATSRPAPSEDHEHGRYANVCAKQRRLHESSSLSAEFSQPYSASPRSGSTADTRKTRTMHHSDWTPPSSLDSEMDMLSSYPKTPNEDAQ
ncbi:hypothetical protein MYAM1_002084 [Malassezia yamatoensis]|uniref:Mitogen-activated protein kinase n=1 Tax=Malassezia yamatoensis TaxID=253288 RepID=A0AAJ6CHH5_9BASI|nr:hypothetical protein MYAM1_002084 [Malassezia yamatoensis]